MNSASAQRISICSPRIDEPVISRCGTIEFEDVVCEIDDVALHPSGAVSRGPLARRAARTWISTFSSRSPSPRSELFFLSVHTPSELARIPALHEHLKQARFAACNIDEVWAKGVASYHGDFAFLRAFDHLFTPCHGGVEELSARVGRPVSYLPPSVDALRFAPASPEPERVIDFHFMGRRRPELHAALSAFARESGRFYLFDSVQFSPRVADAAEHRRRLADLVQRSRAFVVDVANADALDKTGGQVEFGPRYVEGAAGGAVLVGRAPATAAFAAQFGWPDAVLPLDENPATIRALVRALDEDPARCERISRANVRNVLLHHDVAYRWEAILGVFGLAPSARLAERKKRLASVAARFGPAAEPLRMALA